MYVADEVGWRLADDGFHFPVEIVAAHAQIAAEFIDTVFHIGEVVGHESFCFFHELTVGGGECGVFAVGVFLFVSHLFRFSFRFLKFQGEFVFLRLIFPDAVCQLLLLDTFSFVVCPKPPGQDGDECGNPKVGIPWTWMRYGDDVECVGPLSVGVSCLHLHIGVSVWDLAERNGVVSFFHIYPFPVVNSVGESDVGWGVEHKCGEEEGKCLALTVDGKFVCSGEEMLAVNGVGTDADVPNSLVFTQRFRFLQPGLSFGSDNPYSVIFKEKIGESPSFQLLCCSNPTSLGLGVVFLHDARRENPEPSLVVGSDFQHLVAVQVSCDGVVLAIHRQESPSAVMLEKLLLSANCLILPFSTAQTPFSLLTK